MTKNAVLTAPRKIEIQTRDRKPISKNEARIKVKYAGVCMTDISIYKGDYIVPLPLVLGHEWIGEIIEAGDSKYNDLIEKRVTAEINNTCIANNNTVLCPACRKGLSNHCLERTVTGIVNHDGAFAEEIVVPLGAIIEIPSIIPDEDAVFIEPLAAAIRTFDFTKIEKDMFTVIMGAGKLGLLISLVARAMGANVCLVSKSPKNKEIANNLGFDLFIPENFGILKEFIFQKTNNLGADIVIDATGDPSSMNKSLEIVRPQGTVSLKSTPGLPLNGLDITKLVVNEIKIQGTRCGSFPKAIDFLLKYHPPLHKIIYKTFPLNQISEAMEESILKPGKIIIKP